jgi:sec-independent protein translocase protein TatB
MLDLAWSEIAVIAVVAIVIIGPKDLPEAIRGVAKGVQKLRRMAGEFQQQADELVREAKLDDVRNSIQEMKSTINDIRSFDIKGEIEKAVDADGTLQKTMADDPLRDTFMPPPPAPYVPPELPPRPPSCRRPSRASPPPCRPRLNPRRHPLRHPPHPPPALEEFPCPPPGMTIR